MELTLIQGLIFLFYVAFIWIKFRGPLPSISDSWYKLKELGGLWYWLFTFFCWGISIPMLFYSESTTSFFIYSGAGLAFVGAAAMFKLKSTFVPYIHFIGAFIGIICALLGIGIEMHNWIPLSVFVAISTFLKVVKIKNLTWWVEITAFATILYGLLFS